MYSSALLNIFLIVFAFIGLIAVAFVIVALIQSRMEMRDLNE